VARRSRNPLYQPLCAALLAGLFAAGASRLLPSSAIFMIALCPCMILVPGPHFLNGAIDLARFRLPLGAARLGYAGLVVLIISIGLVVGLSVGRASLPLTGGAAVPLAFDVFAAGVAVAAYGTFFSMPWRMLPFPVIVGMAGHALNWSVLAAGAERPTAALAACLFVGAVVTPVANRLRLPFAAVAFASVVSMIPGSFLFRMADDLFRLMQADAAAQATLLTSAVVNATTAVSVLLAMGLGLIIPKIVIEAFDSPGRP
jgi:uncharacterized membrane protein YjjB (DUF3815 family)